MSLKGKLIYGAIIWQDFNSINFFDYYGKKFKDLVFDFTKVRDDYYDGIAKGFGDKNDYGNGAIYVHSKYIDFFEQEYFMNKIRDEVKDFLQSKNRRKWFNFSDSQSFYLRKEFFRGYEALNIGNYKFETINQFLDIVKLVLSVETKKYILVSSVSFEFMAVELAKMGWSWTDINVDGIVGSMYLNRDQLKLKLLDFKEQNA